MKTKLLLYLAISVIGIACLLSAQTIGGDTTLSSKTWEWDSQTTDLAQTTLFTPATNSDFIMSAYVSIDATQPQSNLCIQPKVQYTDQFGSQQAVFLFGNSGQAYVVNGGMGGASGATVAIHALANTPVSVSVIENGCGGGSAVGTYNFVFGKIKINP